MKRTFLLGAAVAVVVVPWLTSHSAGQDAKTLSADQLAARHPETRFGSVVEGLVHVVAHFALHRGQMSYIARLVQQPRG